VFVTLFMHWYNYGKWSQLSSLNFPNRLAMSIHFGANCAKIHTTVPKKIKKVDSLAKVSVSFTK